MVSAALRHALARLRCGAGRTRGAAATTGAAGVRCLRGGQRRGRGAAGACRCRARQLAPLRRRWRRDSAGDVLLGDAAGVAAAGDRDEVDAVRLGHLARGRRRLLAVLAGLGAAGDRRRRGAGGRGRGAAVGAAAGRPRRRCAGAGLDDRQHVADLHVLAFLVLDAAPARRPARRRPRDRSSRSRARRAARRRRRRRPRCFNQRATRASTTDSPSWGTTMLMATECLL